MSLVFCQRRKANILSEPHKSLSCCLDPELRNPLIITSEKDLYAGINTNNHNPENQIDHKKCLSNIQINPNIKLIHKYENIPCNSCSIKTGIALPDLGALGQTAEHHFLNKVEAIVNKTHSIDFNQIDIINDIQNEPPNPDCIGCRGYLADKYTDHTFDTNHNTTLEKFINKFSDEKIKERS